MSEVAELIRGGKLPTSLGAVEAIGAPTARAHLSFDRIDGMLFGLAIGDALGNTNEGQIGCPSE